MRFDRLALLVNCFIALEVHRPAKSVVRRPLDTVGKPTLAGELEHLIAKVHKRDGHARFDHRRFFIKRLIVRRSVEKLVLGTQTADYRQFLVDHRVDEIFKRDEIFFLTGNFVILGESLKTTHHLVSLFRFEFDYLFLLRVEYLNQIVVVVREADFDYLGGEVEVVALAREFVQFHHRFEN